MGIHSRFQYALGFAIGIVLHMKAVQDVEESISQQKQFIISIKKRVDEQVLFREDVEQPVKLARTFLQVYQDGIYGWWVGGLLQGTSKTEGN